MPVSRRCFEATGAIAAAISCQPCATSGCPRRPANPGPHAHAAGKRLIAFITEGVQIRQILEHIGVDILAPRIAPARGPPLREDCVAQGADGAGQGARIAPEWANQPKLNPTTRSLNAPIGERANRRCRRAVGRAVPMVLPSAAKARAGDASGPSDAICSCLRRQSGGFEDGHGGDIWAHGVEFPILFEQNLRHSLMWVIRIGTTRSGAD